VSTRAAKRRQKDIDQAATRLLKSGVLPSASAEGEVHLTRTQQRQLMRSLGWRGSKAQRHNVERGLKRFGEVMLVEQALDRAQDRVDHPVRSRLRRR
jgi:hypothetical protein